jgi:hypothetical protein
MEGSRLKEHRLERRKAKLLILKVCAMQASSSTRCLEGSRSIEGLPSRTARLCASSCRHLLEMSGNAIHRAHHNLHPECLITGPYPQKLLLVAMAGRQDFIGKQRITHHTIYLVLASPPKENTLR